MTWNRIDPIDFFFGLFVSVVCLLAVAGISYGVADTVQSYRSRPAQYACLERNLQPVRLDLSSRVACQSRLTGADSLTVKVAQ